MKEIWKDIRGYEGLYQVSNMGNVKSLERMVDRRGFPFSIKERILKKSISAKGYLVVNLIRDKKAKLCLVHRLVAITFIPNPDGKLFVDHINCNKFDCKVSNLRWVTAKENSNNPITYKRLADFARSNRKRGGENKLSKKVFRFNLRKKLIKVYPSTLEASIDVGVNRHKIQSCIYGSQMICANSLWGLEPEYKTKSKLRERYLEYFINKHCV